MTFSGNGTNFFPQLVSLIEYLSASAENPRTLELMSKLATVRQDSSLGATPDLPTLDSAVICSLLVLSEEDPKTKGSKI